MGTRQDRALPPSKMRLLPVLVIFCCCGCISDEFHPEPVPKIELLQPVTIKIHHSSTVVRKEAGGEFDGLIVACEVKDRFGDPVKALGAMRFEAYAYARSQPGNKGRRVGFWSSVSIDSLQAIQQHWDSVWGLYRFNLEWRRPVKPKQRFVLEVTLSAPQGEQLCDSQVLEVRR